uniref:Uncharacterized protein n=1 Tax=Hyaloperonospora arabidopsidis (strain Emoy2) TaxID=559515 RepID=M4C430_HYAAE
MIMSQIQLITESLQQQEGTSVSQGLVPQAPRQPALPTPSDTIGPSEQVPRRAIEMTPARRMELDDRSDTFETYYRPSRASLQIQMLRVERSR